MSVPRDVMSDVTPAQRCTYFWLAGFFRVLFVNLGDRL